MSSSHGIRTLVVEVVCLCSICAEVGLQAGRCNSQARVHTVRVLAGDTDLLALVPLTPPGFAGLRVAWT
jgi:hypothetical protein